MKVVPDNLLGALWLQFALSLNRNIEFRACRYCNTPFKVSRGQDGVTKRRQFCPNNPGCKMRWHREMAKKAAGLKSQGLKEDIIAKKLDVSQDQVASWLKTQAG